MSETSEHIVVVGAGMGGLASAIRLGAAGYKVTLIDRASGPGGKMRTVPSPAGPVDAGPTVLTMRHQFDALFELCGERLEDHVTLWQEHILARHWWPDGSTLDLTRDGDENITAIAALSGQRDAASFRRFTKRAQALFAAFETPMMEEGQPSILRLGLAAMARPGILPSLLPGLTLRTALKAQFRDPRLRQLFGRYATYVGGIPSRTPALLQLIWQAEAAGVWCVEGGLHRLADALGALAARQGVTQLYNTGAERLERQAGRIAGVHLSNGRRLGCDAVVFNGDPMALSLGLLGESAKPAVRRSGVLPRSLSARVWAFAATPNGPDLAHHNVFFGQEPEDEFGPIAAGQPPKDPTLYICAQDRGRDTRPPALERFEIIENAAPSDALDPGEKDACRTRVFHQLAGFGLTFTPTPGETALTVPAEFHALFPASFGSLYGRSPHGMTASLARPRARTAVPGLYLAGGGAHPGAGIAMATLSGKHAAAAIATDLALPSMSPRTVMPGGISTGSRIAGATPSRSSPS